VSRSAARLLAFEFLGFAAAVKKWARTPRGAWAMLRAWGRGHAALFRDLRALREMVARARRRSGDGAS
jgi:hypothetical protein